MTGPSRVMRSASHKGTRPPCSGRSALPARRAMGCSWIHFSWPRAAEQPSEPNTGDENSHHFGANEGRECSPGERPSPHGLRSAATNGCVDRLVTHARAPAVDGDEAVERKRAGAEGCDRKRNRSPIQMKIRPALRIGELDHARHKEKAERRPTSEQSERKQDRQHDFGRARYRRRELRHWKWDLGAEEMELVLVSKQ